MSRKTTLDTKRDYFIDSNGAVLGIKGTGKFYAIVSKCGHCDESHYVPIIFTTEARDFESAIQDIKNVPRVKRDQNFVLAAYEISFFEKFWIEKINDEDRFLTSKQKEDLLEIKQRQVVDKFSKDDIYFIKTAEQYDERFVVERAFAPRFVGSDLVIPSNIRKDELLHEFFKNATIQYGIKEKDAFFMFLYYVKYGEENDLSIKFENKKLTYFDEEGVEVVCVIPDHLIDFINTINPAQTENSKKKNLTVEQMMYGYYNGNNSNKPEDEKFISFLEGLSKVEVPTKKSAMDKFIAKYGRTKKSKVEDIELQPE